MKLRELILRLLLRIVLSMIDLFNWGLAMVFYFNSRVILACARKRFLTMNFEEIAGTSYGNDCVFLRLAWMNKIVDPVENAEDFKDEDYKRLVKIQNKWTNHFIYI